MTIGFRRAPQVLNTPEVINFNKKRTPNSELRTRNSGTLNSELRTPNGVRAKNIVVLRVLVQYYEYFICGASILTFLHDKDLAEPQAQAILDRLGCLCIPGYYVGVYIRLYSPTCVVLFRLMNSINKISYTQYFLPLSVKLTLVYKFDYAIEHSDRQMYLRQYICT